jgi:hypothetical protein
LRAAPKILTGTVPSFDSRTFLGGFFVQLQPAKNKIDTSDLVGHSEKSAKSNEKIGSGSVGSEPARRTA